MLPLQSRPSVAARPRTDIPPRTDRPPLDLLAPGWPATPGEPQWLQASLQHQFWHPTEFALDELVAAALYNRWAPGCTIPAFATAFRHSAHDAQRHHGVLQALVARDWPLLSGAERSEVTAQVRATARLLSTVLLEPVGPDDLPGDLAANQRACAAAACKAGLGVPTIAQRQELLRMALLQVKTLLRRYGIPFPAIPELAITGIRGEVAGVE